MLLHQVGLEVHQQCDLDLDVQRDVHDLDVQRDAHDLDVQRDGGEGRLHQPRPLGRRLCAPSSGTFEISSTQLPIWLVRFDASQSVIMVDST